MSVILEILYRSPGVPAREEKIAAEAAKTGGTLDFREEPTGEASQAICLTYEFPDRESAERAAENIRSLGEHVEGPSDYS